VVDKIKQSAVAERRVYIVEVMGRKCGYLAMMSGLASGAERIYLNEEGVTLKGMEQDLRMLIDGFRQGKRVGLIMRNEEANPTYDSGFMAALFGEEGAGVFTVRVSILGHLQQGGDPSPFDRIHATSLARRCVRFLIEQALENQPAAAFIGMVAGSVEFHALEDLPRMIDAPDRRPKKQWWLDLRTINNVLARSGPATMPQAASEAVEQD
jgi:6-phosphofructokinase 1